MAKRRIAMDASSIMRHEMTQEKAAELGATGWWKDMDQKEVARLQLAQPRLFMDFTDFVRAVEKLLNRGVWTHEFTKPQVLIAEAESKK
jgi:hypothetical protein